MGFLSVLSFAQKLVEERLHAGGTAVDATVGNGVDTLFLCKRVGPRGAVYGCDIQPQAIERARRRLAEGLPEPPRTLDLQCRSHHELRELVPAEHAGRVDAVMFNLGYLPGYEDESGAAPVITVPATTLPALEAALELLRPGGVLTVVLYPGHDGGGEEAAAVEAWASALPQERCQALRYQFQNRRASAPYLLAVEKRR
ncbi:class I SAM-dependent methyltransferase [Paenibacillus thermoaerophilus]|uniref:Class I SAM-dependent methyltransferase n=1 Tax=Paenibacillus thermoaerophilus TaxID=1215385 RepID=A0ABW2V8A4_9BACL|nr:class I SAM-dependent methyltransferase [Paenibacillus thermoaerophilus]TMV15960.1 methyltransferase domain-containing protein [Paenibacillus thermoaerophilus]